MFNCQTYYIVRIDLDAFFVQIMKVKQGELIMNYSVAGKRLHSVKTAILFQLCLHSVSIHSEYH